MTNPINMRVLPTEQCLTSDGVNVFTVAGQFTQASSFVDSYQLCDPNGECFVASAGVAKGAAAVAVAAMVELATRARGLVSDKRYSEAAGVYMELGRRYTEQGTSWYAPSAMTSYDQAANSYRNSGNMVKVADAYYSAARVAGRFKMDSSVHNYSVLAANAYLEAVKTEITKAERFSCYRRIYESLQVQVEVVRANREAGIASDSIYEVEILLYKRQIEALKGARSNDPMFGIDTREGKIAYSNNMVERANVYERMGDAYLALRRFGPAARAYSKQYDHLLRALPLGEEVLVRIRDFEAKFHVAEGSIIDAATVSTTIRQVLTNKAQERRMEQALFKLASDGGSEREMDRVVRLFERSYVGRERQGMEELTGNEGWLGRLEHAAERAGKGEIISAFRTRASTVLGAKVK